MLFSLRSIHFQQLYYSSTTLSEARPSPTILLLMKMVSYVFSDRIICGPMAMLSLSDSNSVAAVVVVDRPLASSFVVGRDLGLQASQTSDAISAAQSC